ncbi:MAG TPA: hypothetical protein VGK67_31400 [Myxococcales bacterium]
MAAVARSDRVAAEAAIADLYAQERVCPPVTIRVGRAWLSLGEPGKALEACNRGLSVITDGGDRYLLSRCKLDALEKLSRHPEAIAAAKEYLREAPTSSWRHLELAKLLEKDAPAEALSHVREAMLLRPVCREAYYSPEAQNEPDREAEEMLRLYGRLQTRQLTAGDGVLHGDAGP